MNDQVAATAVDGPTPEEIGIKILHILSIFPVISPTMLQSGLSPGLKPVLWKPVLRDLIKQGKVVQTEESKMTPAHRYNEYTKLSLPTVTVVWAEVPSG